MTKCEKLNIKVLTYGDSLYPTQVKDIKKSPVILYYRGNLIEESMGVAIVGSRRCTEYGKRLTVDAGKFLAQNNIPVISGMAKGIDGYAHTACLKVGGYTIAILGCGLDICYPKEHIELMQEIIERGAVVSEYPPGTSPDANHFPMRNRLISAWCKKLLVVEAGEKSGSLLTAAYAKEQNREVFAAPNSIYIRESVGTNKLIEEGSKIYLNPSQLLDQTRRPLVNNTLQNSELIGDDLTAPAGDDLTALEKAILIKIKDNPMTLGQVLLYIKEDKSDVLETISIMELEGKLINNRGIIRVNI
ncbi:MAG: DNA-processing protein DprA [Clostridium sp.]|uniref:DNA-processing protein DprA n=1 Tax=Clostridium sp. TaxID=1506 RepID=UPI003D6D83BF